MPSGWHALRRVNGYYDRLVAATSAPTRDERVRLLAEAEAEIGQLAERWTAPSMAWLVLMSGQRAVITDRMTDLVVAIMMPALREASTTVDRAEVDEQLEWLALAVAGYRREHDEYPPTLEALVPDWIDTVPMDIFDPQGHPVRYRTEDERVVIYSVGRNGKDNGGVHDYYYYDGDQTIEWPR